MENSSSTKNRSGVNTALGTDLALQRRELHAMQEGLNTATSLQIHIWIWSRCLGSTLFVPVCHSQAALQAFLLANVKQGCECEPREPITPHFGFAMFLFLRGELQSELGKLLAWIRGARSQQFVYIRVAEKLIQDYESSLWREKRANIFRIFL